MTDKTYLFRLRGDAAQLEASAETAARAVDKLAGTTESLVRDQAKAAAAGDRFIQSLQREAAAIGKTRSELLGMEAATLGVSSQAQPLIQRLQAGEKALGTFNKTGKLTAVELQQVGFQLNDLGVQIASGQSPLIALVQQGSQLSGTFGGVGNAVRAVGSLITPTVVGFGALAATVGAVALAYSKGYTEQAEFERSLLLTGNRAGVTADEMRSLSRSIADSTILTVGASREALQAVVASGQYGTESLGAAATAVGLLADRTGKSVDEIVKDFAQLQNGVARGAAELNKSYNFLTLAQFRYIRELEAGGKVEEARAETLRLLAAQIGQKTPIELGLLERALKSTKDSWSEFWNAALNIGRTTTVGDQLATATAAVEGARSRLAAAETKGAGNAPDVARKRERLAQAESFLAGLREEQRFGEQSAQQQAAIAATNQKEIREQEKGFVDAGLEVQRAGFAQRQALGELARARELASVERQFAELAITQEAYARRRFELERAGVAAKAAAIDQEIALEQRRAPENEAESAQRQARLIDLRTRRLGVEQELFEVEERRRRGAFAGGPRVVAETPQAAFRQSELAEGEAIARQLIERQLTAQQGARELVLVNRSLGADLIRDERARGEALIAIEEEQLRKRLDLAALAGEDRIRGEEAVAEFIVLRQRQLGEQLKPEYQRLIEDWRDVNKTLRETSDEFQNDFLSGARDTWREFTRTGKLSFEDLGNLILDSANDLVFKQSIAPLVAQGGNAIAQALGFGAGTPSAGAAGGVAGAAGQTAQTAAVSASTTALTVLTASGVAPSTTALVALTGAAQAAATALINAALSAGASGAGGSGIGSLVGSAIGSYAGGGSGDLSGAGSSTGFQSDYGSFGGPRARGGSVTRGKFYQINERVPEILETGGRQFLMNPPPGRVIPSAPLEKGGGGGGTAGGDVFFIVENNAPGVQVEQRESTRGNGDREVRAIITAAKQAVAQDIRGGGQVADAMRASFPVQRKTERRS